MSTGIIILVKMGSSSFWYQVGVWNVTLSHQQKNGGTMEFENTPTWGLISFTIIMSYLPGVSARTNSPSDTFAIEASECSEHRGRDVLEITWSDLYQILGPIYRILRSAKRSAKDLAKDLAKWAIGKKHHLEGHLGDHEKGFSSGCCFSLILIEALEIEPLCAKITSLYYNSI